MDNNNNNNYGALKFLAGVLVGGATLYYLNTPQGKEFTTKMKNQGIALKNQAQLKANELAEQAKKKASTLQNQASSMVSEVKNNIENTISNTKESIQHKANAIKSKVEDVLPENTTAKDFKEGVARAKRTLKNGVEA